jgi:exonuclease III
MVGEERMCEFENALEKINWEIVGLSEVRRIGENLIKRKNGNYFYYFGETKGYRGVGFYINAKIWNKVYEIKSVNERICTLKIDYSKRIKMTIIQVYAPTLEARETEKDQFYESLINTINEEREYYTIVMGDFNGKIGKQRENSSKQDCVGPYALEATNNNGKRMIELALAGRLKIAGTFFKKKLRRKWTWISPNGITRNEIDHLLTNDMTIIKDISPITNFKFASDHKLVKCKIQIKHRAIYDNCRKGNGNLKTVIPIHNIKEACEYMKIQFRELEKNSRGQSQHQYSETVRIINKTGEKYGKRKTVENTDDKISRDTKNLIDQREKLEMKIGRTVKEKIELSELNKLIRKKIKQDRYT